MESRLPKPKIQLGNSISGTITNNMKVNNQKMTKDQNVLPQSSSNSTSETLKKAKSTININSKSANENKPPPKQNLVRSKTMSSIVTKGVKRPATGTTMHTEAKKQFTRPVKPTIQRTGTMLTGNTTNKTVQNATGKTATAAGAAKPSKWDLKGRLAHKSNELSNIQQLYKETASKYNIAQEKLNTLETNVNMYKSQAEKYENLNKILDTELREVKAEREDLSKRLEISEELFKNASESLKLFKEKCTMQEAIILEHNSEVKELRTNLDLQKQMNDELMTNKNELQSLVHTMDKDRRILHNAIQELKGNIRVFCRVRPRTPTELGKVTCTMNFVDECTIEVGKSDGSDSLSCSGKVRGTRQEFSFDKVFPPTAKQEDIFEELALLVQSALEGYNVCVFAYGQTGSGKTYTMEGVPGIETEGMIPRTVRHIFQEMKQFQLLGWEYRIEASFLEIYNEHIIDLLDSQSKTHEIRMADSKGHDLYVSNLKIEEIHSPEELHECLLIAQRNRAVAATQSNERSSRSHSVTRIKLIGVHNTKEEISIGNLNLVDLAGSERLKGEESVRMAETKNINKSLANLGNVILALLKRQEHIPYRNSKLTHLLMPSLGGNSKTLMLLNISPLDECYNETLNSLRFASNVNNCKTGNIKRTRTVLQNSS
ncbi:protein claret segregational [Nomia melanderi]|uniref:protein claret segregational n=1 Tax=Nomia melanderi TaxID=2448451 RepID=UPI00130440AA|nr:protein claret segregational [Nomia melanderi]XP_031849772.1 protein claret segregational [Nomia melanderi]XP_031849773.1 protein claret segregational [Nomia melanderi]